MSTVRENLMTRDGYAPYCGSDHCMNRAPFNGVQFACRCGWQSSFEPEFIEAYKAKWAKKDDILADIEQFFKSRA